jgi:hypothetical protein
MKLFGYQSRENESDSPALIELEEVSFSLNREELASLVSALARAADELLRPSAQPLSHVHLTDVGLVIAGEVREVVIVLSQEPPTMGTHISTVA